MHNITVGAHNEAINNVLHKPIAFLTAIELTNSKHYPAGNLTSIESDLFHYKFNCKCEVFREQVSEWIERVFEKRRLSDASFYTRYIGGDKHLSIVVSEPRGNKIIIKKNKLGAPKDTQLYPRRASEEANKE